MGKFEASPHPIVLKPGMNIGHVAAEEDDDLLFDCFVRHPAVDKCSSVESPEMIVAGRTGSGKTAIMRFIEHDAENVVQIDPMEMSLSYVSNSDALRFVEVIGGDLDLLFQVLWKHVICIEFIRLRYKVDDEQKSKYIFSRIMKKFRSDPRKQKSLQYLRGWEGQFWITMDKNIEVVTEKYENQLRAVLGSEIRKFVARGQYNKQLSTEKKEELVARTKKIISSTQLVDLNNVIEMLAEQSSGEAMNKHYIIIDKLDERWVDDAVRFRIIRSLIESLKTFRKIRNLKVLVAMRSDILERVVQETRDLGFQREKFDSYFVNVKWKKDSLKELVQKRVEILFRRQYSPQTQVKFEDIFRNKVGYIEPFEYIVERTLFRPRDLIMFINLCLVKAEGKTEVTASCIREAEREYSMTRRQALENEWQSAFPSLGRLLDFFSHKKSVLGFKEICDKGKLEDVALNVATERHNTDPVYMASRKMCDDRMSHEEFLKIIIYVLYRVGAIGVKLSAEERYWYSHIDRPIIEPIEMGEELKVRIHPMLYRALAVVERA